MTSWQTKIFGTSFLITYIFVIITIGDASVTWRRLAKSTSKTPELESTTRHPTGLSTAKPVTKSPIVWKRSTIVRRSTDAAESRDYSDESDELNKASSETDEDLKELENDSEVKPLVPGSRPGFWFDSSRKKKPASLLRPGSRRNSLFPTRSSTTADPTISIAPFSTTLRTPSEVLTSNEKNVSRKLFGRNKSTSSPVAFRRRLKSTRAPNVSSTTEIADLDEDKKDEVFADPRNDAESEREREDNSKELKNNEAETDDLKPKRPQLSIRRRPYNGTRLSWTKRKNLPRTTPVPQQLTTTSVPPVSTQDYERISRKTTKFPRTRTRSKTRTTPAAEKVVSPQTTTLSTKKNEKSSEESMSQSALGNRGDPSYKNKETIPRIDAIEDASVEKISESGANYGSRQVSKEQDKSIIRTTVEPFYITRDYGRVATAIADVKMNEDYKEISSTSIPKLKKDNEYNTSELKKDKNSTETSRIPIRKKTKRIRVKVTDAPKITSTVAEKLQNTEKEYDYENEDFNSSFEYIDDFRIKYTTTEDPTSTILNGILFEKKPTGTKATTLRPLTLPTFPTIDPSSNAYVVWSVGHGGSGWSYQRQGGNVKWSAQNSEAEGDSWSVVGKDEENEGDADLNYQWTQIKEPENGHQKSERITSDIKEKLTHFTTKKDDSQKNFPVIYMPKLPVKNETILNFKKSTDTYSLPYHTTSSNSFDEFKHPVELAYYNNATLPQIVVEEAQPASYTPPTPSPIFPTIEDHFNAEVDGIINQYPIASHYPYVAEIRETYKNTPIVPTNDPTTKSFEFQEFHVTQNAELNKKEEPLPSSPVSQEQYVQDPPTNLYPTILPQEEISSPHKNTNILNQYPTANSPYQNYQSNVPPELAKAVVKSKKWRIAGSGGEEGWSLMNEDGMLEWKLHNVDGVWRVTNAEDLAKPQAPLEPTTYATDNDKSQTGLYGYSNSLKHSPPKVWTLEDDYEKWRTVSSERGSPTDVSLDGISTSSQEYDYESEEYNGGYYPDDYYYNSGSINPDTTPYQPNTDYAGRPLWKNGENKIIQNPPNPSFSGNIEIANSKADAIASWKSLVAQQGHWKFVEDIKKRKDEYSTENVGHVQERNKNGDRKVSTSSPRRENNHKAHSNFQTIISDTYNAGDQYQHYKNNNFREENTYERGSDKYQKFKQIAKENNDYLGKIQDRNYDYNVRDEPKETIDTQKTKTFEENFDSEPVSGEQNYGHFEKTLQAEKYLTDRRHENKHLQERSKFSELGHEINIPEIHKELEQNYQENNNHDGRISSQNVKYDIEQSKHNSFRETNQYGNENSQFNIQKYTEEITKTHKKSAESIPEPQSHLKTKDHSKLDSLINKLEAIQKEANGRAVIDLTALLNQMKARRNITSSTMFNQSHSSMKHGSRTMIKDYTTKNVEYPKNSDTDTLSGRMEIEQSKKREEYLQDREVKYESENRFSNWPYSDMRVHNNASVDNEYSQNQRLRYSDQSNKGNRLKRPSTRSQNAKEERISNNHTMPKNVKAHSSMKATETNDYKIYPAVDRAEKVEYQYGNINSHLHRPNEPEPTQNLRNRDSFSSEEFVVDLRDENINKSVIPKRKRRPSRRRSRRPHHPPPIVMKGETEVEDEENGSRKSRKIIVIDYAGTQQKKSSVDKKDLELIIRNVKHRRSEVHDESQDN